MKKLIITAAGGNATAIQIISRALSRSEYATIGRELILSNQDSLVEQSGFLIPKLNHFEMSGGEFCGNTARAAALLLSILLEKKDVSFSMSGFANQVSGNVSNNNGKYIVTCSFPGLPLIVSLLDWPKPAAIIDLGGIVHVVIEDKFPEDYENEHRRLISQLGLLEREAVGVVWAERFATGVRINPVVWVKEINSFFYESSCGSGSIAVAKFFGLGNIEQPSGKFITVELLPELIKLSSEMEIIKVIDE